MSARIGLVAIGRNEGPRLERCLRSVVGQVASAVYVDSGSTDGSVELAAGLGVEVVELDPSTPFTAARARNEGFARLLERDPEIELVQFVDGDCEVADGWLDRAAAELQSRPDVAVVCGRRRERDVDGSIYNRLIDLEWDTPVGEASACGGDSMMRVEPLRAAGGFNAALIAGEEPELCLRLRREGRKIVRIDAEMTRHDAAMTRLGQWWRRAVRCGHAYAEGAWMHGRSPERYNVRQVGSTLAWGVVLPVLAIAPAWVTNGWSLLGLLAYPLQWVRIAARQRRRDRSGSDSRLYATSTVMGKFAQCVGIGLFALNLLRGRRAGLIEYKAQPAGDEGPSEEAPG